MTLDYLKIMGIDRWTLRQNVPPILPSCYAYELWHQNRCVGILFAEAASEEEIVTDFLKKIIAAIKYKAHGGWYPMQPDYAGFDALQFVITLGEGFEVIEGIKHIHGYSPKRLLTEPKLKVEVWKDLQTIIAADR